MLTSSSFCKTLFYLKEDKLISLKCGDKVTFLPSIKVNLAFSVRPTYNQGYRIKYELLKKFYLYSRAKLKKRKLLYRILDGKNK